MPRTALSREEDDDIIKVEEDDPWIKRRTIQTEQSIDLHNITEQFSPEVPVAQANSDGQMNRREISQHNVTEKTTNLSSPMTVSTPASLPSSTNLSLPPTQLSPIEGLTSISRLRQMSSHEWKIAKDQLEERVRPAALRYGKVPDEELRRIILSVIGEEEEESILYRKCLHKVRGNIATWKCKTLFEMRKYVERMVAKDRLGLSTKEKDPQKIFKAFETCYDFSDAEVVFPWAAKYIKFSEDPGRTTTATGPGWIKTYFLNLAVRVRLHLLHKSEPWAGGVDNENILHYYDQFPHARAFREIKPTIFEMKPRRHGNRKISQRADEVEIYGVFGIMDMPRGIDSTSMETNRRESINQQEEVEDGQEDLEEENRENATTKEGQLFRQG